MYYDKLEIYKKYLRREKNILLGFLIFWSVILVLLLWGSFSYPRALIAALIPLGPWLVLFFEMRKDLRLLRELDRICAEQTINKTYDVTLYRPRVTFMVKTEGGRGYRAHYFYGITITAPDKKKYYYFFDELLHNNKENVTKIEEKLYRELTFQCYEGTSIIRTMEKDPYFLRIRWGTYYG